MSASPQLKITFKLNKISKFRSYYNKMVVKLCGKYREFIKFSMKFINSLDNTPNLSTIFEEIFKIMQKFMKIPKFFGLSQKSKIL